MPIAVALCHQSLFISWEFRVEPPSRLLLRGIAASHPPGGHTAGGAQRAGHRVAFILFLPAARRRPKPMRGTGMDPKYSSDAWSGGFLFRVCWADDKLLGWCPCGKRSLEMLKFKNGNSEVSKYQVRYKDQLTQFCHLFFSSPFLDFERKSS